MKVRALPKSKQLSGISSSSGLLQMSRFLTQTPWLAPEQAYLSIHDTLGPIMNAGFNLTAWHAGALDALLCLYVETAILWYENDTLRDHPCLDKLHFPKKCSEMCALVRL